MPNRQGRVSGELRALIRHEKKRRGPGITFQNKEIVSLLAYSPRLCRAIPEFTWRSRIVVQYPVQLIPPTYMDCMEKGNEMITTWTVQEHLYP